MSTDHMYRTGLCVVFRSDALVPLKVSRVRIESWDVCRVQMTGETCGAQNQEVKNGVVICTWQKLRAFPPRPSRSLLTASLPSPLAATHLARDTHTTHTPSQKVRKMAYYQRHALQILGQRCAGLGKVEGCACIHVGGDECLLCFVCVCMLVDFHINLSEWLNGATDVTKGTSRHWFSTYFLSKFNKTGQEWANVKSTWIKNILEWLLKVHKVRIHIIRLFKYYEWEIMF